MKITVKHNETEIVVEDNQQSSNNYALVGYNQEYIIKLIGEMAQRILEIKGGNK